MNQPVTYKSLYEQYARRERGRQVIVLAGSAVSIVTSIWILRQLVKDQQAVRAAMARDLKARAERRAS